MVVTPAELAELALKRHREPWNWTIQFAALPLACLTFLTHSYLLAATTLILISAGFLHLKMDEAPDNRWFRFVHAAVEWEKNWIAAPWNWYKGLRFLFFLLVSALTIWALWTHELATLGLLLGFAVLVRVVRENKQDGIEP